MPNHYPHLTLGREEPVPTRRKRPGFPRVQEPEDIRAFGLALQQSLRENVIAETRTVGSSDARRLLRLQLRAVVDADLFRHLASGIEIVSQESSSVVIAFATEAALAEFEQKLTTLSEGGRPTYRHALFALKDVTAWGPEDRRGAALLAEGWPADERFLLDVELFPSGGTLARANASDAFERWLREQEIRVLDSVRRPYLALFRVQVAREQAELLLRYRDVRCVDLPPRYGLSVETFRVDVGEFPAVPSPPADAPGVVVLDSGIVAGHPLLASATGDAQSFFPGLGEADESGHGTHTAGIALYHEIEHAVEARSFIPELRLFSGRILDRNNEPPDENLLEHQVDSAVRYFVDNYGCKVFNLSYGDGRKPYDGRHVRGLAITLDQLSRELGVLFVLPTGNFSGTETTPTDWREEYPQYLLSDEAAILDPAPALNCLTVGSLCRYDASTSAQRFGDDPAYQPVARRGQPSPFTRSGPSVGGAIKPDLVAFGGNAAVDVRQSRQPLQFRGLGELSLNHHFADGGMFREDAGTSFSAPHVAHLAARLHRANSSLSTNAVRALLTAHARWTPESTSLLPDREELTRLCGYGEVDERALAASLEDQVTLMAEDAIRDGRHHFYELPLVPEYFAGRRRTRELSVAMAYTPPVRSTRLEYRASAITFRVVEAVSLEHVVKMFNSATNADEYVNIPELAGATVGKSRRSRGTVQREAWSFREFRREKRIFVVVTRVDENWAEPLTAIDEPYALAVVVRDRENSEARLYTQIRARLRARVAQRVRA